MQKCLLDLALALFSLKKTTKQADVFISHECDENILVNSREGCYKATALCSVKSEACLTGKEQLRFCFGKEDHDNWDEKITSLVHTQIKKVGVE